MDFHGLEALQCMVERRRGGESEREEQGGGEHEAVWKAGAEGRWSKELLEAALSRSDTPLGLTEQDGRTQDLLGSGELRKLVSEPAAYCIQYNDGLEATLLMLNGAVRDYCFAARLKGSPDPVATQFFLTPGPNVSYSACLVAKIDEMLATGNAPYPVERTLLVSGILESCLTSRLHGHRREDTPHLDVRYRAPSESQHARA